jgi:hypothetical protein
MKEFIPESRVEKALTYLAETDEQLGQLVGRVESLYAQIKAKKAVIFLNTEGSVAERNAVAECAGPVITLCEEHSNAVADRETIKLHRRREELIIDVWRTCAASNRRGNV